MNTLSKEKEFGVKLNPKRLKFNIRKLKTANFGTDILLITDRKFNVLGLLEKNEGIASLYLWEHTPKSVRLKFKKDGLYVFLDQLALFNLKNMNVIDSIHIDLTHRDIKEQNLIYDSSLLNSKVLSVFENFNSLGEAIS